MVKVVVFPKGYLSQLDEQSLADGQPFDDGRSDWAEDGDWVDEISQEHEDPPTEELEPVESTENSWENPWRYRVGRPLHDED
jgi:hypothetical protein